ncbi:MAG: tRNA pseudouridine(55) synthase, partial [Schleiferiaceae bacterium]
MLTVEDIVSGQVLLVDKPLEWTSYQAVAKIKYALQKVTGKKKLKVGHAGTLDPLATGLLIICVGKKTKEISDFMGLPKEYVAHVKLGATTPSYDLESAIDAEFPTDHINLKTIEEA